MLHTGPSNSILCFALCLLSPAANGHSDCLRMMIDYGEEGDLINVADKFGQWVFFFLLVATDECLIRWSTWDSNHNPAPPRRTPLMLAVLGGHTDCVHFLLEKGALPDAKDKRGSTALHRGVSHSACRSVAISLHWTTLVSLSQEEWIGPH